MYEPLLDACTTNLQRALVQHLIANPESSIRAAARAAGLNESTAARTIKRLQKRVAKDTPSLHIPAKIGGKIRAPGFGMKGVSSLVNARGELVQQWIKTKAEDAAPEAILEAFQDAVELAGIIAKMVAPAPKPVEGMEDLISVYPVGDPHIGLVAWEKETGTEYDTDKAAAHLRQAIDELIKVTPKTHTAILAELGDLFHSDNKAGVTSRSGHSLDVDPRWARVSVVVLSTMTYMIDRLLGHHQKVIVRIQVGNHDDMSSWMLTLCLAAHYKDEPRVEIVQDPGMFWCYEFGKVLIGVTHGHGCKVNALQGVMSTRWAQEWGRTFFRHWYTGHIHHETKKELSGCTAESFRSLTAKDPYSAGAGYDSHRSFCVDIWHRKYGYKGRRTIGVESLDAEDGSV